MSRVVGCDGCYVASAHVAPAKRAAPLPSYGASLPPPRLHAANYRRLLGDRHWPHATPFPTVVGYLPCPALALRTNKAGLIVGVPPDVEARAVARLPGEAWLTSGELGVAQLKP
jgi:hypothetical protein